tara:strand:- start:159 stop:482 length:324 start_codon:yes stop_codon:yes gene_type:complete
MTKSDDVLDLTINLNGENEMGSEAPQLAEQGNLTVAMTALANEFGASAGRRSAAADQLAADSQRMWSIAMTSPTVMAAHGMRVASEAGAGRTRVEANSPPSSQVVGG